jgi:chromosome segregation ATPase
MNEQLKQIKTIEQTIQSTKLALKTWANQISTYNEQLKALSQQLENIKQQFMNENNNQKGGNN